MQANPEKFQAICVGSKANREIKSFKLNNNEIEYGIVMGTQSNKLSDLLKSNNKIKIINKNHIKIGNEDLNTPNIGIMFFI